MYVVYKVYDDRFATILDIGDYRQSTMSESELVNFAKNHDVMGLSVSGNSVNYMYAYDVMQFPTDSELDEYARECGIKRKNSIYANGLYWLFIKSNRVIHVDYYVWHYTEIEQKYVTGNVPTDYIEHAKVFDRKHAYETAGSMNKARAKKYGQPSSNYWGVRRVPRG